MNEMVISHFDGSSFSVVTIWYITLICSSLSPKVAGISSISTNGESTQAWLTWGIIQSCFCVERGNHFFFSPCICDISKELLEHGNLPRRAASHTLWSREFQLFRNLNEERRRAWMKGNLVITKQGVTIQKHGRCITSLQLLWSQSSSVVKSSVWLCSCRNGNQLQLHTSSWFPQCSAVTGFLISQTRTSGWIKEVFHQFLRVHLFMLEILLNCTVQ